MDIRSNGVANVYTLTRDETVVPDDAWELAREICPNEVLYAGGRPAVSVALLPEGAEGVPFHIQNVDSAAPTDPIPGPYSASWYSGCVRGGILSGTKLVVVSFNAELPADWDGTYHQLGVRTMQREPSPFHPTSEELQLWRARPNQGTEGAAARPDD